MASSAALAAKETLLQEGVLENAQRVGKYFKEKLTELISQFSFVKEVRGMGLMLGLELTIEGKDIVARCLEQGLLINCTNVNVLRFLPPLIINRAEVDQAMDILKGAMAVN